MAQEEIDNLLQQLAVGGQHDSTGAFTLSREKALAKLAQFQLEQPRHYVLNLLAAAVSGGATFFQADFKSSSRFHFDGRSYTESELKHIFDQLLQGATEKPLHEFAVALNAIFALTPKSIIFECRTEERSWRWTYTQGKISITDIESELQGYVLPINSLEIRESNFLAQTVRRWKGDYVEEKILSHRGRFAPIPLLINGAEQNELYGLSENYQSLLAWHQLRHHNSSLNPIPIKEWTQTCRITKRIDNDLDFEAVLVLSSPGYAKWRGLEVVADGVSFQRGSKILGMPFAHGFLLGSFNKNLSHSDLAEDAKWQATIEILKQECEELLYQLLTDKGYLAGSEALEIAKWAPILGARLKARGEDDKARDVDSFIREQELLKDFFSEKAWKRFKEGYLEGLLGSYQVEVREPLLAAAWAEFRAGAYRRCQILCSRLIELTEMEKMPVGYQLFCNRNITGVLAGQEWEGSEPHEQETRALLLRMKGKATQAALKHQDPLMRAEANLAAGGFQEAEDTLRLVVSQNPDAWSLGTLADCLSFRPGATRAQKRESLQFAQEAARLRASEASNWAGFLEEDLALRADGGGSFHQWVSYSVRASMGGFDSSPFTQQWREELSRSPRQFAARPETLLAIQTTMFQIEKELSVESPAAEAARARVCHLLRRFEQWRAADVLAARRHLLKLVKFDF